jgi:hypothetical protein
MRMTIFAVLSLLRLRHITLRHDTKNLSIEAKQMHVRVVKVAVYETNRRLLHQIKLVGDKSMLKPKVNILGRRPTDNAIRLKNDEMNNRNEHEFDRVENKRRRLIRFPIRPKIHIGKPA